MALPAVPELTVTWCDTSRSASVNLEVMKLMKIMLMMVMKLKMNYTVMQFLSFFSSLYRPGFGMVWSFISITTIHSFIHARSGVGFRVCQLRTDLCETSGAGLMMHGSVTETSEPTVESNESAK